jgi:phosphate transport system substrate-binding protein
MGFVRKQLEQLIMRKQIYSKKSTAILWFLAAVLFCSSVEAANSEGLEGEAFTDPSYTQEMPADWRDQPIRYGSETGEADLTVTLDQHLYPALSGLIQNYAAKNGLKIAVSEGTCGITAGKLIRKTVDIGGYCCPPGLTDRLPGLLFHTLGIMPIMLIVHPDNPFDTITIREAREIFQGEIYRWSELKNSLGQHGPDLTIQTIGRLHCKIRPGHWRLLLDNEDLFSPRLQEVGTIPDMISLVAAYPGSIGYEVMMMVKRYQNEGRVKVLKIDGNTPDKANVLSGKYPLYRTLNITTWEGKNVVNPHAEKLVDYLLRQAEQLDTQYGIIPAASLRQSGWQFKGDELVGGPQ